MNNSSPCNDIQKCLSRIEQKIDKIERTLHPPFWKKLLLFLWRNLFSIIILVVIIILGIKVWEFLQALQAQIDALKSMPGNAVDATTDSVKEVIDWIKFW